MASVRGRPSGGARYASLPSPSTRPRPRRPSPPFFALVAGGDYETPATTGAKASHKKSGRFEPTYLPTWTYILALGAG